MIDFSLVFADIATLFLQFILSEFTTFSSIGGVLRITKGTRALRLLAVMRLGTLSRRVERITSKYSSEMLNFVIQILMLLLGIMWINHVLGCAWFLIGRRGFWSDTDRTWLDTTWNKDNDTYADAVGTFQYLTSVHWSLTQMTPSSIPVQPLNSGERVYNIFCLVFGMLFFSSIVSMLSSKIMRLSMVRTQQATQLQMLETFCRERCIQPGLAYTAKHQVQDRMSQKKPLQLDDVAVLSLVSVSVHRDIQTEMCWVHLQNTEFFRLVSQVHRGTLQDICCSAVTFAVCMPTDELLAASKEVGTAKLLIRGSATYYQNPESSKLKQPREQHVAEKRWLCWAALWTNWVSVGSCSAATTTELLQFDASVFLRCLSGHTLLGVISNGYAESFRWRLAESKPPLVSVWPDDLYIPRADHPNVVLSMSHELQVLVGLCALEVLVRSWSWKVFDFDDELAALEKELNNGTCVIVQTDHQSVERVVAVTAVELLRNDGRIFVHLGRWSAGRVVPRCELPAVKQNMGEQPDEAFKRVLAQELSAVAGEVDDLKIVESRVQVDVKDSMRLRIRTRYIRTVFSAQLKREKIDLETASTQPLDPCDRRVSGTLGDVIVHTDGKSTFLSSWMQRSSFDFLQGPNGDKLLQSYLVGLSVDEDNMSVVW